MREKIYISGPITGYEINAHRSEHMREDLKQLLKCTAIYFMPGWEKSAGCQLEFNIATQIGLAVFLERHKEWIVDFSTAKFIDK